METLFGISQNGIGMLVWLLWALIGAFEALLAARMSQKRNLVADLVTGVIAGVLGGYFSIHFAGDSPVQRFLISVMGAVFLAAAAMWIMGRLLRRRRYAGTMLHNSLPALCVMNHFCYVCTVIGQMNDAIHKHRIRHNCSTMP